MDPIKPNYYRFKVAGVEVDALAVIEGAGLGFHLGNALKYIIRAGRKSPDPVEDLKKAREYLDREIERIARG